MERSAIAAATRVVALALLLEAFGSLVPLVALAVFVMVVPAAVARFTFTTRVNVEEALTINDGLVAVTVPEAPTGGAVVAQPAGAVKETKVVFAGIASVSERPEESLGPLLVSVIVYVMLLPARTGSGVSIFLIARSATGVTVVVTDELLFAVLVSKLSVVTDAVSVIETALPTRTVNVNCALVPEASMTIPHDTVPLVPGVGLPHVATGPLFCTSETNVVPGGSGSLHTTLLAASGPALATVIV